MGKSPTPRTLRRPLGCVALSSGTHQASRAFRCCSQIAAFSEKFQMAVSCIGLKAIDLCCHMSILIGEYHDKLLFSKSFASLTYGLGGAAGITRAGSYKRRISHGGAMLPLSLVVLFSEATVRRRTRCFRPSILREGYLMLQHSWRGVKWSWGNHVTASTRSASGLT